MSTHTPAPWKAIKGFDDDDTRWGVVQDGPREFHIVTVENGAPGDTLDTEEANARLIAAAPELLAALKAVEWHGHGMDRCPCCFGWESKGNGETDHYHNAECLLANAIAKAEGR